MLVGVSGSYGEPPRQLTSSGALVVDAGFDVGISTSSQAGLSSRPALRRGERQRHQSRSNNNILVADRRVITM